MYDEITTHGRFAFVPTKEISSKDGLKRKKIQLSFAFVKSSSVFNLLLYSCLLPFFCSCQVVFCFFAFCFMSNIVGNLLCTQSSLSSFLGLLIDLVLSHSASLRKSFLRILATSCVN